MADGLGLGLEVMMKLFYDFEIVDIGFMDLTGSTPNAVLSLPFPIRRNVRENLLLLGLLSSVAVVLVNVPEKAG